MTEKKLTTLQGSELGLGISFNAGIGKEKALVLTAGVPLDMTYDGLNVILDKMAAAINRQELKYRLRDVEDFIEKCEGDLERNRIQLQTYRSVAEAEWSVSGRRGPFELQGKQKNEVQNYEQSETHLITQIKKLREQAKDMREKIEKVAA